VYLCSKASEEIVTISKSEYDRFLSKESRITVLEYQLAELKRLVLGAKSERFITPIPNQPTLFELPESQDIEK
jgi:hypothetical protein